MTEDREKLGLSLCPFCGGTARFGKCVPGEQESENDEAEYIECCDCGASTCLVFPLMDSAKQVLRDMWNRRTEAAMKVELTKEWCMNMAKIEARAAELHEGCRMPMEQARELAASEMSEGRKALLAAFGAAAAAREQGLRGQYPKAATVLAEEVFSLRAALRQKQAEYDDMKSLLLGNVRNVHLEGERAREVLRCMLEAPTTQISTTWKDAARQGLALGPNVELTGRPV